MKKIKSIYHFQKPYENHNGKHKNLVGVILEVDHLTETYNITPKNGVGDVGFRFIKTSKNWRMWKVVTECINDAIDFANKELGIDG